MRHVPVLRRAVAWRPVHRGAAPMARHARSNARRSGGSRAA